jgi:lambda family phage tail tape measure protein
MATERIVIEVSERGTRTVSRNIEGIGGAAGRAEGSVLSLKNALAALGVGLGLRELQQTADLYQTLQNRIALVTKSSEELAEVNNRLFATARDTRSAFEGTVELYSRMARSAGQLGVSQEDVIALTKGVSQSMKISGATASEASGGLIQFGQALAQGQLRADELRSVMENFPRLSEALVKGLNLKGGIGELRQLGEEGKLTAQVVIKALQSQLGVLDEEFKKLVPTIADSLTVLQNAFLKFVGTVNEGAGASQILSNAIFALADNFDTIAKALIGIASGPALIMGLATAFNVARAAVIGLTAAIAANPLGALLVVLTSVLSTLYLFKDEIILIQDGMVTLGDYMSAAFELGKRALDPVIQALEQFLIPLLGDANATLADLIPSFQQVLRAGNTFIGFFVGARNAIVAAFGTIPDSFKNFFLKAFDQAVEAAKLGVNKLIDLINKLASFAGIDKIDPIDLGQRLFGGIAEAIPQTVKDAFLEGLSTDFLGGVADQLTGRAQQIAKERSSTPKAGADLTTKGPAAAPTLSNEDRNKLEQLVKRIHSADNAARELREAEELLNRAVAAGAIPRAKANELLSIYGEQLRDALDPLAAVNRELDKETKLLQLDAREREVQSDFLKIQQDLLDKGVRLSQEEAEALQDKIRGLQKLNELIKTQDQLYQSIRGPQEEYLRKLEAAARLLDQGRITTDEFNRATRDARIEFLETQKDMASGGERALLKLKAQYEDLATSMEDLVIGGFKKLEDAIVEFAKTGKFEIKDLADFIIGELARIAARKILLEPLADGLGGIFKGIGSSLFSGGGSGAGSVVSTLVAHEGGKIGVDAFPGRQVSAELFRNAPRLHDGLAPDEFPAILQRGEQVTAKDDVGRGSNVSVVVINNAPNTQARAEERSDGQGGRSVEVTIEEVVARGVSRSGSPINRAIRNQFGAQQTLVNR